MKYEWYWILAGALATLMFFASWEARDVALLSSLLLGAGVVYSFYTARFGSLARRSPELPDEVRIHRIFVAICTGFICAGVVGIEIVVRKVGGMWGNPYFVALHLSLVATSVVLYVCTRFVYTGEKSKARHKYFAYSFILSLMLTFVTGSILLNQQFKFI